MDIDQVLFQVATHGVSLVELTGGEPLLQKGAFLLVQRLCDQGYTVLIETSGAVSIRHLDRRAKAIVDIKTPGSLEQHSNRYENLRILWPGCEVKLVIGDEADYHFAKQVVAEYDLLGRVPVLFSPMAPRLSPQVLASWIVCDRLEVRFQPQLHRLLWGEQKGV